MKTVSLPVKEIGVSLRFYCRFQLSGPGPNGKVNSKCIFASIVSMITNNVSPHPYIYNVHV